MTAAATIGVPLRGTVFSVDFNPMADALRVLALCSIETSTGVLATQRDIAIKL